MVRWEYKVLPRARAIQAPEAGRQWYGATDWDPADFIDQLPKLGQDGWELVAITSRSNLAHTTAPVAGWTSQEVWVFKRPIDGGESR